MSSTCLSTDESDTEPESFIETPDVEIRKLPEITKEWITNMLVNYHGKETRVYVKSFKIENHASEGGPALSDIFSLQVEYDAFSGTKETEQEISLIIKQLPHDPYSRLFVLESQFDLREKKFYNKIIPDMKELLEKQLSGHTEDYILPVPKCYSPLGDFESQDVPNVVLVLENLKSKGYYGPSFAKGLTLNEAYSALRAIAKLHAISLALKIECKRDFNEVYPFLFQTDKATESYQMLLERGLHQLGLFLESKPNMMNVFRLILNIRVKTKDILKSLLYPREPLCLLTHTDFWCNNLLFNKNSDECVVLDWQMVTYSQPTNDVALLILSSLPAELRRKHNDALLEEYWKCLRDNAAKLKIDIEGTLMYTKQDLLNDYRKSQLLAILLCIGSIDIALGNQATEDRVLCLLEDLNSENIFSEETIALIIQ